MGRSLSANWGGGGGAGRAAAAISLSQASASTGTRRDASTSRVDEGQDEGPPVNGI